MSDINSLIIVGRLTKDVEVKYSGAGFAIGKINIAVNRKQKNGDSWEDVASFFEAKILGKMAESLKPYLLKGKQIAVEGYLQQDRWEKDGQKYSRIVIVVNNIQLIGNKNENSGYSKVNQESNEDPGFQEDIPF